MRKHKFDHAQLREITVSVNIYQEAYLSNYICFLKMRFAGSMTYKKPIRMSKM